MADSKPVDQPKPPTDGSRPVALSRDAAERTEAVVRWVEGDFRGRPRLPAGGGPVSVWARKAKVNASGIAAASAASTPRAGDCELCDLVAGVWTVNGTTVSGYNPSATTAVAANAYVTLAWVGGVWEIVLEPC